MGMKLGVEWQKDLVMYSGSQVPKNVYVLPKDTRQQNIWWFKIQMELLQNACQQNGIFHTKWKYFFLDVGVYVLQIISSVMPAHAALGISMSTCKDLPSRAGTSV